MVRGARRSKTATRSLGCWVFAATALQCGFWVLIEMGIRNHNVMFLPHWGSSFGFTAVMLLTACRQTGTPLLSSSAPGMVEARVGVMRRVSVIPAPPGAKCVGAVCYQEGVWKLRGAALAWGAPRCRVCVGPEGSAWVPRGPAALLAPVAAEGGRALLRLLPGKGGPPRFRRCKP